MSNVANLPDVSFCETDTQIVEQNILTVYQGIVARTLADGDPERLFLCGLAAIIAQQRTIINNTGIGNLLYFATGAVLDYLALFYGLTRLAASEASDTVSFTLPETLAFTLAIPKGTRISPDGQLIFETMAYVEIVAGALSVSVSIVCQEAGEIGNGYGPGEINLLVDPIGHGLTVSNTGTSAGGEDQESDDRFRDRIFEAPESFSIAGPTTAYEHFVKSVRQDIVDVAVYVKTPLEDLNTATLDIIIGALGLSGNTDEEKRQAIAEWLSPSNVHIAPLLEDGGIPDQSLLDAVTAKVDGRAVRPLTDRVYVAAPEQAAYNIDLEYFIRSEDELKVSEIQAAVLKAVDDFTAWQCAELGRAHNPSKLSEMIREAGAGHVNITSPVFAEIEQNQVASRGTMAVNYGGLKDGI